MSPPLERSLSKVTHRALTCTYSLYLGHKPHRGHCSAAGRISNGPARVVLRLVNGTVASLRSELSAAARELKCLNLSSGNAMCRTKLAPAGRVCVRSNTIKARLVSQGSCLLDVINEKKNTTIAKHRKYMKKNAQCA